MSCFSSSRVRSEKGRCRCSCGRKADLDFCRCFLCCLYFLCLFLFFVVFFCLFEFLFFLVLAADDVALAVPFIVAVFADAGVEDSTVTLSDTAERVILLTPWCDCGILVALLVSWLLFAFHLLLLRDVPDSDGEAPRFAGKENASIPTLRTEEEDSKNHAHDNAVTMAERW